MGRLSQLGGVAMLVALAAACNDANGSMGRGRSAEVGGTWAEGNSSASSSVGGASGGNAPSAPLANSDASQDSSAPTMGLGAPMVPGFDMQASLAAFEQTVWPLTRANCAKCHSAAPEGTDQLPMHAHAEASVAHEFALPKVNLRKVESSKLVMRLLIEEHNCWSDCAADGEAMRAAVQRWADEVADFVAPIEMPTPEGVLSEDQVVGWISEDRGSLPAEDQQYARYTSLHELYNLGVSADELNAARAGISKILNSTARYAPAVVNPVAVDPYSLVYRFDVRDYWGYAAGGLFGFGGMGGRADPAHALTIWDRVTQGNVNADGLDAKTATYPNIAGFHADYVEASQLAYTLSRPDVYNEVIGLPPIASLLELQLGVNLAEAQYMTVDDAITINQRMMLRAPASTGYYWKSIDQFGMAEFVFYDRPLPEYNDDGSQIKTTPLTTEANGGYNIGGTVTEDENGHLVGGLQAQASEIIFSLPNGLQAYAIYGAGSQLRKDAFTFVVVDPRRGGAIGEGFGFGYVRLGEGGNWRLLNAASCMSCHVDGLNRGPDGMQRYLDANPGAYDEATTQQVRQLYPGDEVMGPQIEADRELFLQAMDQVSEEMILGTADKSLHIEPIMFLFETAQQIYGYANTESN